MVNDILLEEFDTRANNGKSFKQFTPSSAKKVWWKCSNNPKHKWEARIFSRTKQGAGCPYCKGKKVLPEDSLALNYPELIKEWDYSKNTIDPTLTHCQSGKKAWWKCKNGHEFQGHIHHRTHGGRQGQGVGCPYCSNQKVSIENSLAITHPELTKEWDCNKNKIKPNEVTSGSGKKVWWKCPKAEDHEWISIIRNRANNDNGCPCCCGRKIVKSNCLATTHPEITKQWHITKNKIAPNQVTYATNISVWWKCLEGHEWKCNIYGRSIGTQCPFCASSKGEKRIKEWLDINHINYKREYIIKDCKHIRALPFDFAILKEKKIIVLIEFQGRHHYMSVEYFGGEKRFSQTQINDKIKKDYCENNNIPLLVISHAEINYIEIILEKNLFPYK